MFQFKKFQNTNKFLLRQHTQDLIGKTERRFVYLELCVCRFTLFANGCKIYSSKIHK